VRHGPHLQPAIGSHIPTSSLLPYLLLLFFLSYINLSTPQGGGRPAGGAAEGDEGDGGDPRMPEA